MPRSASALEDQRFPPFAGEPVARPTGCYPLPDPWSESATGPGDLALSRIARNCGIATVLVPFLAVPAIVCGFVAWIMCLVRPYEQGAGRAARAILAAVILAPVSVALYGNLWARQAPSMTQFGSGHQIDSIPVLPPGPNYSQVPTPPGLSTLLAGGTPATPPGQNPYQPPTSVQTVYVTNQTVTTTWSDGKGTAQTTFLALAPSAKLAQEVFSVAASPAPGATLFNIPGAPDAKGFQWTITAPQGGTVTNQIVAEQSGSAIVVILAVTDNPPATRVAIGNRLKAQVAAVPKELTDFNAVNGSAEHRHNIVHEAWTTLTYIDALGVGGIAAVLGVITLFVVSGQKALRRRGTARPGWYFDPAGEPYVRAWTGRHWSSQIYRDGKTSRLPLPSER